MATILVLDDDAMNLDVIAAMLSRAGHHTLRAASAAEGISVCTCHDGPIDLTVADVILEDSSGREAAARIAEIRPKMPVLFISGYALPNLDESHLLSRADVSDGRWGFLQKPFTARELNDAVARMLPRSATAGAGVRQ